MKIEASERARQATAVGNAITRLHRDYYGRGATTTRTMYQRDHVVVFLEDICTPVERTLIEAGRHEDVRRTRQVFQDAMRERFSQSVEEITGRKVRFKGDAADSVIAPGIGTRSALVNGVVANLYRRGYEINDRNLELMAGIQIEALTDFLPQHFLLVEFLLRFFPAAVVILHVYFLMLR